MDNNKIIEQLYLEHKDHVYNFIARMANDPDLAMDVTQQTFVKALCDKNITELNNPRAYLFTIARNTLFNEFKRKKASSLDAISPDGNYDVVDESAEILDASAVEDIQDKIEQSIKRMPDKVKELMILRYTEDLSIKEISAITGRTLSDVKVNLHRARIKFESSFTNEMYAKVALSRDQCDVLTGLLQPYDTTEIPEQQLAIVDKHISGCKICFDDAEQLKRTRVLFNLGVLISAPYILDKMMSEAMASEFTLLANAGTGSNAAVTSVSKGSSAAVVKSGSSQALLGKILSSKFALMGSSAAVVTLAGLLLLTNLFDDQQAIETTSSPATSTAKPTAPAKTVKIDFNATAIVNFKALDKQTGQYIFQGLTWQVFNITDNGKPNLAKQTLVQTSDSSRFNIILDAGYYLAKASYQGKVKSKQFVIKDDNAVDVEISFGESGSGSSPQISKTDKVDLPTIHIRRKETGSHESKPLKVLWDLCVLSLEGDKMNRNRFPAVWEAIKKEHLKDDPTYNIDRGLVAEPNWSTITQNYEDEYFSGNKYALYRNGRTFTVSKNGSCELIEEPYKTAIIDNGVHSYDIDFIKKTGTKSGSEVIYQKKLDEQRQEIIKNNPFLTQSLGKAFSDAFIGKEGSAQHKKSLQALDQMNALTKVVRSETVAGESCEYLAMGEKMGMGICYWKTMHDYQSYIKREVVLKTTFDLSNGRKNNFLGKVTKIAILFEKNIVLSDKIFSEPDNITIQDTSVNDSFN